METCLQSALWVLCDDVGGGGGMETCLQSALWVLCDDVGGGGGMETCLQSALWVLCDDVGGGGGMETCLQSALWVLCDDVGGGGGGGGGMETYLQSPVCTMSTVRWNIQTAGWLPSLNVLLLPKWAMMGAKNDSKIVSFSGEYNNRDRRGKGNLPLVCIATAKREKMNQEGGSSRPIVKVRRSGNSNLQNP